MYWLGYTYLRFLFICAFPLAVDAEAKDHTLVFFGVLAVVSLYSMFKDAWEWQSQTTKPIREVPVPDKPNLKGYIGTQRQFDEYFGGDYVDGDSLIGSAIKHPDGTIYAVIQPGRHGDCIRIMDDDGDRAGLENTANQGFITNYGEYVSRKEGKKIAMAAEQLKGGKTIANVLTSEDLW